MGRKKFRKKYKSYSIYAVDDQVDLLEAIKTRYFEKYRHRDPLLTSDSHIFLDLIFKAAKAEGLI